MPLLCCCLEDVVAMVDNNKRVRCIYQSINYDRSFVRSFVRSASPAWLDRLWGDCDVMQQQRGATRRSTSATISTS